VALVGKRVKQLWSLSTGWAATKCRACMDVKLHLWDNGRCTDPTVTSPGSIPGSPSSSFAVDFSPLGSR
jgi:hypothetical protein